MLISIKNNINFQEKATLFINYLLVTYAFFLPISPKTASVLMIFIALLMLFLADLKERFSNAIHDKIVIALIMFYFMHFIWMIGSEHIPMALLTAKEFKYILYIIVFAMVLKKEFISRILSAFLLAILFSVLMSYSMYFHLDIPFINLNPNFYATTNVPFMLSYTQYGSILAISLGIILYQILRNKNLNLYLKIFYIIFFISASIDIFLLASRIGYLLYFFIIATVMLFIYRDNIKRALLSTIGIVLIIYIATFSYSDMVRERSTQCIQDIHLLSENNFSTSLGIRTGYYKYSIDIIKENLFFGLGTNDHIAALRQIIIEKEKNLQNKNGLLFSLKSGYNASFDSEYLDLVIQFGLIGLLIFLNIFYQIFRYKQEDPNLRVIQLILICSMLLISFGSIIFIARDVGTIFILLISLTLNIKPLHSSRLVPNNVQSN